MIQLNFPRLSQSSIKLAGSPSDTNGIEVTSTLPVKEQSANSPATTEGSSMFDRMIKAFSPRPTSPKPPAVGEQITINQRSSAVFDLGGPVAKSDSFLDPPVEEEESFHTFKDEVSSVEMENPMLNRYLFVCLL